VKENLLSMFRAIALMPINQAPLFSDTSSQITKATKRWRFSDFNDNIQF
jgi:hypothetical protein